MVRFGEPAFALEGMVDDTRLSLNYTPPTRSLRLDGVLQSSSADYLSKGRIVWFEIDDVSLVNGSAERRRKLLDSAGLQSSGSYGLDLKTYDKALRSRNLLLREGKPRREIDSYTIPMAKAGDRITAVRAALVSRLAPLAADFCRRISGEDLEISYLPGSIPPLLQNIEESRQEEIVLRQTRVGPHRDDVNVMLNGIAAGSFASEGQRRTVALSLKLAVSALLAQFACLPPLLLLDDIFGELDPERREALLREIPIGSQALLSTTELTGISVPRGSQIHRLGIGSLCRVA